METVHQVAPYVLWAPRLHFTRDLLHNGVFCFVTRMPLARSEHFLP